MTMKIRPRVLFACPLKHCVSFCSDDENINLANMRVSYMYMICLFVTMSVLLSYYYISIVRDQTNVSLTNADDIRMNNNISFNMLQRVQDALKEEQFPNIGFDGELMSKAIQAGNHARLKKVLKKVLRGEDVNLLVIGGSNSAGGRLGVDENSLDGLYFKVFAKWWNKTFGKVAKSFMKKIQLTIGGTGSPFFAFCYKTFIGEGEKIDIVLIEISANDLKYLTSKYLEQLTRQLLEYPSEPALLSINVVGGLGLGPNNKDKPSNPACRNLETYGQTELARHYEITSFSLKEIFCRKDEKGQWKVLLTNMTASDGSHISLKAHALVASLMIKHVRSVMKELINDVYNAADQVDGGHENFTLPKFLLIKRESEALMKPLCWTGKTPNAFKNLHQPNLQLKVINNKSFSRCFQLRGKGLNVKSKSKELRTDSQGGWCAWKSSSTLQLEIYVPMTADSFLRSRSVIVLFRCSVAPNKENQAEIWLDNNKDKAIKTYSASKTDNFETIATRVNPGYHTITVRTLRKGTFMLCGVFVGPPDFSIRP